MAIFRGIVGIIIGGLVAYMVGIMLDYFHFWQVADAQGVYNTLSAEKVYPFLTALGGGIAALIAIIIRGGGGTARVVVERASKLKAKDDAMTRLAGSMTSGSSKPASSAPSSSTSTDSGRLSMGESKDVPGMPTFDVKSDSGSGSRPKAQQ